MNKHGTAATRNARTRIVIDLDYEIVQVVGSRQAIAFSMWRKLDPAVVSSVAGVLTPTIAWSDASCR